MHITESVYENNGMIIRLLSHIYETMKEVRIYVRTNMSMCMYMYVYIRLIYRAINNLILHWMDKVRMLNCVHDSIVEYSII